MIDKFDEVKAQLQELAPIINSFQSEAVQLRIVDLILGQPDIDADNDAAIGVAALKPKPAKRRSRRKQTAEMQVEAGETPSKNRPTSGRPSAAATLERLIQAGFFKQRRGIGDIVNHCGTTLALQYKQSDFSPTLVRAVRDGKLKRSKNDTGQYEYEAT